MKSKYLNMHFGPWVVSRVAPTTYGNYRYCLTRKTHDGAIKTVSITSKVMKKLAEKQITIPVLLKNKQWHRDQFPSRAFRNSVWYTFNTNGSLK